jgi:hypothetical protein
MNDASLRQRGSLTVWFSAEAIKAFARETKDLSRDDDEARFEPVEHENGAR